MPCASCGNGGFSCRRQCPQAVSYTHLDVYKRQVWPYLLMGGLGAVGIAAFVHFVISGMENSENFRFRRVIAWLNPEKYASDLAYQTMQALYAIGSGGLFGKGLGNSTQKMVLPEAQNDKMCIRDRYYRGGSFAGASVH